MMPLQYAKRFTIELFKGGYRLISAGTGGYTATGDAINYMIVHPSAILQVVKHQIPRIFSPEVNQEADAWKFDYRVYHDCWVKAQKTNGIYVSHA